MLTTKTLFVIKIPTMNSSQVFFIVTGIEEIKGEDLATYDGRYFTKCDLIADITFSWSLVVSLLKKMNNWITVHMSETSSEVDNSCHYMNYKNYVQETIRSLIVHH